VPYLINAILLLVDKIVTESLKKGNMIRQTWLLALLIMLVAICAFGLGRLSVRGEAQESLIIHEPGSQNP
jgi:hypothetical protein